MFIGFPQVPLEVLSEFANCGDSDNVDEANQTEPKTNNQIMSFCITIDRPQGIFGRWVDSTLVSCTNQLSTTLETVYILGCEKLNDSVLEESIKSIERLKVTQLILVKCLGS